MRVLFVHFGPRSLAVDRNEKKSRRRERERGRERRRRKEKREERKVAEESFKRRQARGAI